MEEENKTPAEEKPEITDDSTKEEIKEAIENESIEEVLEDVKDIDDGESLALIYKEIPDKNEEDFLEALDKDQFEEFLEEIDIEERKDDLRKAVRFLIDNKRATKIRLMFDFVPTIDIAEAIDDLEDVTKLIYLFRIIGSDYGADLFAELTDDQQELIVKSFTDKELIKLLENSYADDVVDTIEDMPANLVTRILKVAPADLRSDINTLLNYKEHTAGSVMTTEYFDVLNTLTAEQALNAIRTRGREAETVNTVFVRDNKRTLVGVIGLEDLIFAKPTDVLDDIMDQDFVTCNVNDDQEDVANKFKRYDLTAMAVVNKEDKMIGLITVDDVVDIIVEEATEDIARMNNVSNMDTPYLKTPIHKLVLKCVPWIIALMVLQIGSAAITSAFDSLIARFAILAVFSPLILDAGGNSGGQTTTMMVRSIALDEFDRGDFKKVLWKEFRVALLIALIIGVFAFGWTFFEMAVLHIGNIEPEELTAAGMSEIQVKLLVAALVGSTLMVTMIISRMIGCVLPFLAKKLHLDPAVMCSPFTTTIVDIVSLLTYFLLWQEVFSPILGIQF